MAKKRINSLDRMNHELQYLYSDSNEPVEPLTNPIVKYYHTLTKEQEEFISSDTAEYLYLPKSKVVVAQTFHGNIAIGKNTKLYKKVRKNTLKFEKKNNKKTYEEIKRDEKTNLYNKIKRTKNKKGKKYMNKKTSKILNTIIGVTLGVGAVIGVGALIGNAVTNDGMETIHPSFEVGGLTQTGKYEETDLSIYTKNSFECQGLRVILDFDSNVEYQIFFYDEVDNFVSTTDVYDESQTLSVPETAMYARCEVTPIWAEGTKAEDKKLGFFDISKYANQLKFEIDTSVEEETTTTSESV